MTETFTLVHLSDVHLGPLAGFHVRHLNTKRLFGFINWRRGRRFVHLKSVADRIAADAMGQNPDHIAVTGDLANLGLPEEYANALSWLATFGDPERVSVVPGNHDIYTGRIGTSSCLDVWAAYMRSSESWADPSPVRFPYVRIQGSVALVGLNSAVQTPLFVASGRLGEAQCERLASILLRLRDSGHTRVVLIHHPPLHGQASEGRALRDARELTRVLERCGAELVLHGHNHREMQAWCPSEGGNIPVVGVASASVGFANKSELLARYHVLRIQRDGDGVRINCEVRGLDEPDGPVVSLIRRDLIMPQVPALR